MIKEVKKKAIVMIIIILLAFLYFAITNISNAADVIGTWDISEDDGQSHVTATLYSDENLVISGTGAMKGYIYDNIRAPYTEYKKKIKKVIIENGITTIGTKVFIECENITTVEISDSVISIKYDAFDGCKSLTQINIPNSVISIEGWAFYRCTSLTNVKIGNSVTSIGDGAFVGCTSLTEIEIPESVTSIGDHAFSTCTSLETIEIPRSVTNIGYGAFSSCTNLKNIIVSENNENYSSINGILYNKDRTNIECYPSGKEETEYSILEGVINIKESAFQGCTKLTSIEIPNSVTSIERRAFDECISLTKIEIPSSVTIIRNETFKNCSNLTNVIIPEGVIKILDEAFLGCNSLTSISIPSTVTYIDRKVFMKCDKLNNIFVMQNNNYYKDIDGVLFTKDEMKIIKYPKGKTNTNYVIPEGVTSIYDYAFAECKNLVKIEIPDSITSISSGAFDDCTSLVEIEIPNNVTRIGSAAFYNCTSLEKIEIPNNVTEIEIATFRSCTSLKQIYIPKSVINIGFSAFSECEDLTIYTNSEYVENYAKGNNIGYVLDKTGPSITFEKNPIDWTNDTVTITIMLTDDIVGVKEVLVDNELETLENNIITIIANENKSYQIVAKDKLGNISEKTIRIDNIDKMNLVIEDYEVIEEYGKKYLENIKEKTTIRQLKEKIVTNGIIEIYKVNTKVTGEDKIIETGMTIKVKRNNQEVIYEAVVKGDLTGDGQMKVGDVLKLARYKAGLDKNLSGAYLRAGDIVKDGNIGMSDILKLSRVLAGIENL